MGTILNNWLFDLYEAPFVKSALQYLNKIRKVYD